MISSNLWHERFEWQNVWDQLYPPPTLRATGSYNYVTTLGGRMFHRDTIYSMLHIQMCGLWSAIPSHLIERAQPVRMRAFSLHLFFSGHVQLSTELRTLRERAHFLHSLRSCI